MRVTRQVDPALPNFLMLHTALRSSLLACVLVVSTAVFVAGQACPKYSEAGPRVQSEVRALEGQLVFHFRFDSGI